MSSEEKFRLTKLIALLGLGILLPALCIYDFYIHFIVAGIITYINLSSVKLYVRINNIFSFCKVFACLVVIGGGIYQLAIGNTDNLKSGFEGTTTKPGHIALAFYNGLWAYDGWSSVTTVTEEIKRPEK